MAVEAPAGTDVYEPLGPVRAWLRSDMRMLRWVLLGIYALIVMAPLGLLVYEPDAAIPFLIMGGILVGAQALFIFGAGTIQLCRPIRKRRLIAPVIVAALMFTLLIVGLLIALSELLHIDESLDGDLFVIAFWGLIALSWIGWGVLIFSYAKDRPRFAVLSRISGALFAGSLLELLATVPSHVIVIRRPGCLVGLGTMLGIIAGLNVMFFSFGPMVLLLFLRPRYRRERAMGWQFCEVCGYDLRASPVRCPECGTPRRAAT